MSLEEDYLIIEKMSTPHYEIIDSYRIGKLDVKLLQFAIPLDHDDTDESAEKINVVARLVYNAKTDLFLQPAEQLDLSESNICVYLQGGPGFGCPAPEESAFNEVMLSHGFQMLYLDQRGTGLSNPLDSAFLVSNFDSDEQRLEYIKHFRALDIVKDAEFIRKLLIPDQKWSLLGQSYGGFCSTTYLSYFPNSLKQVLITGGIPPINGGPDDVYSATYKRTEERNVAYYSKYPQDVAKVHDICHYLTTNGKVALPNGGFLSVERLQATGISFGGTGGTDFLHQLIFNLHHDLQNYGRFTFASLNQAQNALSFDTNIIYFLFQELIYLDSGKSSNWSADRLRLQSKVNYTYERLAVQSIEKHTLEHAVYFTGEMVYKSMLDDFVELAPLKSFANLLHTNKDWGKHPLYLPQILRQNTVPVAAATYYYDQYVDFNLTMQSKLYIQGIKQYITNEFFHNGLRKDPKRVLDNLMGLLHNGEVM